MSQPLQTAPAIAPVQPLTEPMAVPAARKTGTHRNVAIALCIAFVAVILIVAATMFFGRAGSSPTGGFGKPGAPAGTWSIHVNGEGYDVNAISLNVEQSGKMTMSMMGIKLGTGHFSVKDYTGDSVTYSVDHFKAAGNNGQQWDDVPMTLTIPRRGIEGDWEIHYTEDGKANDMSAKVSSNGGIKYAWDLNGSKDWYDGTWQSSEGSSAKKSYKISLPPSVTKNQSYLGDDNDIKDLSIIFDMPSNR
ncbi:hypothetical protein [Bifidobacterium sp. ESL0800]|uniref:hypothetical protein n=1 Tax=Bifidobacterium sp. ESL0800 TaxID=2983236 RepID=UPI0023F62483|nr:hypothetical protein [Bifidobacterium sp. ESL0800]WEV76257.1 hypothetical protein OZX75_03485 [Bifidobacterium sp. ESL0800]